MILPFSLIIISVLTGFALLWVFRMTSNQEAVKETKKRLQARLLEMRLYGDDPGTVFKAQGALLRLNARYLALMLRPAVFATVPMVLLLLVMDGFYGKQPLDLNHSAIVTVQLSAPADAELEAPDGIEVETPAVRAMSDSQVSWRIRPTRDVSGELRIVSNGASATKSVRAGQGIGFLSSRRVGSVVDLFLHPGELPVSADGFEWIDLEYPSANVSMFGISAHWLVWFLIFSMVPAYLLKGKFGVTL